MNDTSWVKLNRNIEDTNILKDPVAYALYSLLLIRADRKTGIYSSGRNRLASDLNQKPPTIQKALKRLEKKYKLVSLSSISNFTEICLLEQPNQAPEPESVSPSGIRSVSHEYQVGITKQEVRINKISPNGDIGETPKPSVFGNEKVNLVLEEFKRSFGRRPTDKQPRFVASNFSRLLSGFVLRNKEAYLALRGKELTFEYVLTFVFDRYASKDYAEHTELLETVRSKAKAFLADTEDKLKEEYGKHVQAVN